MGRVIGVEKRPAVAGRAHAHGGGVVLWGDSVEWFNRLTEDGQPYRAIDPAFAGIGN